VPGPGLPFALTSRVGRIGNPSYAGVRAEPATNSPQFVRAVFDRSPFPSRTPSFSARGQRRKALGITAELFLEFGHVRFEVRLGNLSDHAMPRQTRPRLSSDARLGFSFQLPLPQHVVENLPPERIGFDRTIFCFGFDSAPAGRSRREETSLRAIGLRALQRGMPDSRAPAESKQHVAWCETWCLNGEKV